MQASSLLPACSSSHLPSAILLLSLPLFSFDYLPSPYLTPAPRGATAATSCASTDADMPLRPGRRADGGGRSCSEPGGCKIYPAASQFVALGRIARPPSALRGSHPHSVANSCISWQPSAFRGSQKRGPFSFFSTFSIFILFPAPHLPFSPLQISLCHAHALAPFWHAPPPNCLPFCTMVYKSRSVPYPTKMPRVGK